VAQPAEGNGFSFFVLHFLTHCPELQLRNRLGFHPDPLRNATGIEGKWHTQKTKHNASSTDFNPRPHLSASERSFS
jgi:hypothetical protein